MEKNTLFTLLIFLFLPLLSFSQQFGIKAGLNYSMMANNIGQVETIEFSAKPNWHAGLWSEFKLSETWGIKGEFVYTVKGAISQPKPHLGNPDKVNLNFEYLELPLLIYHKLGRVRLQVGGAAAAELNHYLYNSTRKERVTSVQDIWGGDIDFSLLGGIEIQWKKFQIGARYQHGLVPMLKNIEFTDVNGSPTGTVSGHQHRNLMLSLGYILWKKE